MPKTKTRPARPHTVIIAGRSAAGWRNCPIRSTSRRRAAIYPRNAGEAGQLRAIGRPPFAGHRPVRPGRLRPPDPAPDRARAGGVFPVLRARAGTAVPPSRRGLKGRPRYGETARQKGSLRGAAGAVQSLSVSLPRPEIASLRSQSLWFPPRVGETDGGLKEMIPRKACHCEEP
jgi:hypothetical protein